MEAVMLKRSREVRVRAKNRASLRLCIFALRSSLPTVNTHSIRYAEQRASARLPYQTPNSFGGDSERKHNRIYLTEYWTWFKKVQHEFPVQAARVLRGTGRREKTMRNDELKAVFDKQAPGYEKQWERMAPIRAGLQFMLESIFVDLPEDARILCVGVGTGAELAHLARKFPDWRFTVVEPAPAMLEICRQRAKAEGFTSRCYFHEGYLDSLPTQDQHDAATCFLVSQFMLDQAARSAFFQSIANRLRPGGILASSDLASDVGSIDYEALLPVWLHIMSPTAIDSERLERARAGYAKDVAILPPSVIASIIEAGGFAAPVQFFQAGLMHAWFSKRVSAHANSQ